MYQILPKRAVWSLSLNELDFEFDTSSWGENKTTDKSHWALFGFAWRLIAVCLKAGFRNFTSDTTEHDILFRHMLLLTNSSEWPSSGRNFFGNSPAYLVSNRILHTVAHYFSSLYLRHGRNSRIDERSKGRSESCKDISEPYLTG